MKKLLCYFIENEQYENTINYIVENFIPERIFVFDYNNTKLLTFNSDKITNDKKVIILNRNSQTNTLYTLNGLNNLILNITGNYDKLFKIDWTNYQNKLIIACNINGYKIIDLSLNSIIRNKK